MSIIEKAMRKIAPSAKTNHIKDASRAHAIWHHQSSALDRRNDLKPALANAQPTLALNYSDLQARGVLAPDDMIPRVNDEYRRIKRPLLANVSGETNHLGRHSNVIMVTSSVAGEGKTHVAINLALSLAREVDYTVLLVDADVIRRETSELLGAIDKPGLIDLLHNHRMRVEDLLLRTEVPYMAVLPAGQFHEQTTELLSSGEMKRLVAELSGRYPNRIIIFDSPPLLSTTEAQIIAGLMDQIVLVVEAGRTPPSTVEEALATLNNSKPIGLVLNKRRQLLSADDYGDYYYRQT